MPYGLAPVAEYEHAGSACSITGVDVYHSDTASALEGVYFNSDSCSGDVWDLVQNDSGNRVYSVVLKADLLVSGAGYGEDGSLYLTSCTCLSSRDYDPRDAIRPASSGTSCRPTSTRRPRSSYRPRLPQASEEPTPTTAGEGTPEATPGT